MPGIGASNTFVTTQLPLRTDRRLRVAVLAGGNSDERRVSLNSGTAVAAALQTCGHRVLRLDPSITPLSQTDWSGVDAVFIALHGRFGEDGQVQAILEHAGVPFTGSDSAASRLAFHKTAAKKRFRQTGVNTPPAIPIVEADTFERIAELAEIVGYPVVIKPDAQGSSIGVSIVREAAQLAAAVQICFARDTRGLIEAFMPGSEWTLGLFDDQVLPLIRIRPAGTFFDYHAKYEDDRTNYELELSDVPMDVQREIVATGVAAARAMGTCGIARVDLMQSADGTPMVLEVNTVPGFTDHSLVPMAAAKIGLTMAELCESALQSAIIRHAKRAAA